ncbi:MAG: GFA family protein [Hyphomonas sp.]
MSLNATCQCGQLSVALPETGEPAVVICHCEDCQRRTGSPFGVGAYYDLADVMILGKAKEFTRKGDSGGDFTTCFCETCGTSLYWFTSKHPAGIGVAVGGIAKADFTAPVRSVYECCKHDWVELPEGILHFDKGRMG